MIKHILLFAALIFGFTQAEIQAQCEADHTVYLTDFVFTPSALPITVGESVAFINAEGNHNVDGTNEDNPESFFLESLEGNIDGVCMVSSRSIPPEITNTHLPSACNQIWE